MSRRMHGSGSVQSEATAALSQFDNKTAEPRSQPFQLSKNTSSPPPHPHPPPSLAPCCSCSQPAYPLPPNAAQSAFNREPLHPFLHVWTIFLSVSSPLTCGKQDETVVVGLQFFPHLARNKEHKLGDDRCLWLWCRRRIQWTAGRGWPLEIRPFRSWPRAKCFGSNLQFCGRTNAQSM